MWRPDLTTLRLFVAVCEEQSFSRAADRQALAISAVSKRVSELELAAGIRLLNRAPRAIEITPAGAAVLRRARQVLDAVDLLGQDLKALQAGDAGRVRVLAALSAGLPAFGGDLAAFMKGYPRVTVDVEERMSPEIAEGIRDGSADIGLGYANPLAADLHQVAYADNTLSVLVGAGHPWFSRERVNFNDIAGQALVALRESSATTQLLKSCAAREGLLLHYSAFTSNLETAFRIIADGAAIGVFGSGAGLSLRDVYGIRSIDIDEHWATRPLVIYSQRQERMSLAAIRLRDFLTVRRKPG